ncbi:MAG: response regulator, partial [Burkholderiales bacterium]
LLKRGYGKNEADARKYLETIHSSGKHLLELINDILDLSKIEAGHLDVERVSCSPHFIVREVVNVLGIKAREKGIKIDFSVKGRIPATIQSDPAYFRRIVTNLVGNAIKFTEQGGVQVVIWYADADATPQLAIDVIDSGIGIAPEKLETMFDPFVQADSSVTRRFGGTGLGLTISRRFARALGGDIVARSTIGRGSTFTVTVDTGPLAGVRMLEETDVTLKAEQGTAEDQTRWEFPRSRVLVVDDGPENRELLALVLSETGIEVEEAENGQAGVAKAREGAFDAILMDMQMPVMDGFTATRLLREAGLKMPILALTANAMKGSEKQMLDAGCTGYLTKPINIDLLLRTLANVLGGKRVEKHVRPSAPAPTVKQEQEPETTTLSGPPIVSRLANNQRLRPAIRKFAGRLDEQLLSFEKAWSSRNFGELASLAHWLKGAGGTVGYDAFTEPAARLEKLAKDRSEIEIEAAILQLRGLGKRLVVPDEEQPTQVAVQ